MAANREPDWRSDEALIEICNEGDSRAAAAAFETLYLRHRDYVLRVALRFAPCSRTFAAWSVPEPRTHAGACGIPTRC